MTMTMMIASDVVISITMMMAQILAEGLYRVAADATSSINLVCTLRVEVEFRSGLLNGCRA